MCAVCMRVWVSVVLVVWVVTPRKGKYAGSRRTYTHARTHMHAYAQARTHSLYTHPHTQTQTHTHINTHAHARKHTQTEAYSPLTKGKMLKDKPLVAIANKYVWGAVCVYPRHSACVCVCVYARTCVCVCARGLAPLLTECDDYICCRTRAYTHTRRTHEREVRIHMLVLSPSLLHNRYRKDTAQIMIRWCLQKGYVVLPKSVTPARIASNADVFGFDITHTHLHTHIQTHAHTDTRTHTNIQTHARTYSLSLYLLLDRYGKDTAQIMIRWCLQKGYVVLPKSVTPARIASNADVFGFDITLEDMAALDKLDRYLVTGWDPTKST